MQISKKNAQAAWNAGCDDVKTVLENLFPVMVFQQHMKYEVGQKFNVMIELEIVSRDTNDDDLPYRVEITNSGVVPLKLGDHWFSLKDMDTLSVIKKVVRVGDNWCLKDDTSSNIRSR